VGFKRNDKAILDELDRQLREEWEPSYIEEPLGIFYPAVRNKRTKQVVCEFGDEYKCADADSALATAEVVTKGHFVFGVYNF